MASKKSKLKEILAGIGEKISPSIKKGRLKSEANTAATDKAIKNIVHKRKMRKRGSNPRIQDAKLTSGQKSKLFKGKPVSAFERAKQVKELNK